MSEQKKQPSWGWIVVQVQIVGSIEKWDHSYTSDLVYHPSRHAAIRYGIRRLGHDDFLIVLVEGGAVKVAAWQFEDHDDAEQVEDIARQLALTGGPR